VASRIKNSERRIKALNHPDYTYFGWAGDPQTAVGASFGSLKQRKVGLYITFRFNPAAFDYAEEIERDENNDRPYLLHPEWTGEPEAANTNLTVA
jgi:hypothetical protein